MLVSCRGGIAVAVADRCVPVPTTATADPGSGSAVVDREGAALRPRACVARPASGAVAAVSEAPGLRDAASQASNSTPTTSTRTRRASGCASAACSCARPARTSRAPRFGYRCSRRHAAPSACAWRKPAPRRAAMTCSSTAWSSSAAARHPSSAAPTAVRSGSCTTTSACGAGLAPQPRRTLHPHLPQRFAPRPRRPHRERLGRVVAHRRLALALRRLGARRRCATRRGRSAGSCAAISSAGRT